METVKNEQSQQNKSNESNETNDLTLYNETNDFVIKHDNKYIVIQKCLTPNISLSKTAEYIENKRGMRILGIIGIIKGRNANYLLVINKATCVGSIHTSKVYKIDEIKLVSFIGDGTMTNKEDKEYEQMITDFVKRNSLYFSDTFDLTTRITKMFSRNNDKTDKTTKTPFSEVTKSFCWNHEIGKLYNNEILNYILIPVINGGVGITTISYNVSNKSKKFTFILISRKDTRRSGMRFLVRGADSNGNVANYVETEQIILTDVNEEGDINLVSYLQVRGSIPLSWKQEPDLQLNPEIKISQDSALNQNICKKHLVDLMNNYTGKICLLSLNDRKKEDSDQRIIGDYYYKCVKEANIPRIDFSWFDFHEECKNMKYENISKMLKAPSVWNGISTFGYTQIQFKAENKRIEDLSFKILLLQDGIFRTNCIDCLDRTNVIQSVIARQILHKILNKLGLEDVPTGEVFESFLFDFETKYKEIWADNGDYLSMAYTGTNALKGDFTRYGKKTYLGTLNDGKMGSIRYYVNAFCDGYNQDCHDLFLGKINPNMNLKGHSTTYVHVLLSITLITAFIIYYFAIGIALPEEYEDNYRKKLFRWTLLISVTYMTFKMLFFNFKSKIVSKSTIDNS